MAPCVPPSSDVTWTPFHEGLRSLRPQAFEVHRGRGLLPHLPSPHVWKGFLRGLYTGYSENLTNVRRSRAAQHRSPASHGDDQAFPIPPQASTGQWARRDRALYQRSGHLGCELCQQGCSMTRTTQPVETEALRVCRETVRPGQPCHLPAVPTPFAPVQGPLPGVGGVGGVGWVRWGVFWIEPCPRPPSYLFFSSVHCWPQSSSLDRRR